MSVITLVFNDTPSTTTYGGVPYTRNSDLTTYTYSSPSDQTSIGDNAFLGCASLVSISIPNSVTSIGNSAFDGCTALQTIIIPSSVTSIGIDAFAGVSSTCICITNHLLNSTIYTTLFGVFLSRLKTSNFILQFSGNAYNPDSNKYTVVNTNWLYYNGIITAIPNSLFQSKFTLINAVLYNGITSIGYSAFNNCSNLTSITIPNSVTSIDTSAFQTCNLQYITLPINLISIGVNVFNGCTGLKTINIPNKVTYFDQTAFNGCSNLTSVTFSSNSTITSIGYKAFQSCTSLASIIIPSSVKHIDSSAFNVCNGLTSVTIPTSVTNIGTTPFNGCIKLQTMIIEKVTSGNTMTSFNNNVWGSSSANVPALTVLFLPSTITSITLTGNYPNLNIFTDGNIAASPYTTLSTPNQVKAIIYNTYSSPWTPKYPATITGSQSLTVGYNSSLYTSSFGVSSNYTVTDQNINESSFKPVSIPAQSSNGYGTYTLTSSGSFNYTLGSIGSATASDTYTDSVIIQSADNTPYTINITINPQQLAINSNNSNKLTNAGFTLGYFISRINSGNIPVSFISTTLLTAGFNSQDIINLMNHPTTAATIAISIATPIITHIKLSTNIKLGSQFINGKIKIQSKYLKIRGKGKLTA